MVNLYSPGNPAFRPGSAEHSEPGFKSVANRYDEILITMLNAKPDNSRFNLSVDGNCSSRGLDRWVGRPTASPLD